jgi:hypothetical protein
VPEVSVVIELRVTVEDESEPAALERAVATLLQEWNGSRTSQSVGRNVVMATRPPERSPRPTGPLRCRRNPARAGEVLGRQAVQVQQGQDLGHPRGARPLPTPSRFGKGISTSTGSPRTSRSKHGWRFASARSSTSGWRSSSPSRIRSGS